MAGANLLRHNIRRKLCARNKPTSLLILLLAALALCIFAGCDSGNDLSTSDLDGTTWVATAFATDSSNNSVQVIITLTFASGSYQIEYALANNRGTSSSAGSYTIDNDADYSNMPDPLVYLRTDSSSTLMTLYYYESYMTCDSFSFTLTDSSGNTLARLSSVSLTFNKQ